MNIRDNNNNNNRNKNILNVPLNILNIRKDTHENCRVIVEKKICVDMFDDSLSDCS